MSDFKDYLIEYQFEGAQWGATIKAASFDDAKRRIETMGAFGRIKGEVVMTVPAGGGWFVKALCWLRNRI